MVSVIAITNYPGEKCPIMRIMSLAYIQRAFGTIILKQLKPIKHMVQQFFKGIFKEFLQNLLEK